ncbi:phosphatidylserine synthase, putative, partial [Plasmodium reichenowi]
SILLLLYVNESLI